MSHWTEKMNEAEAAASAAWERMQQARKDGNRRAENKAWREHSKHKDAASRFRAFANPMEVSASGFAS
ncbi:hypothetical protein CC53_gp103 [Rhizobium phage vB_RleS_L338C]|uniref:hypothetical protein n=1 Tax=Rhizobium phage vB_RleS_L338C TaxID=1414737 RepID=UPI0003D89C14|nr:hypothetical protein CC53_gp103 [Rhizobium phage vB_RleS_L338C]AHC30520.1 hypothetical protein L338C_103 [Rhizobium phage vB_RleS_L338C]QNH72179.1 hypothetical protein P11VFA_047 [Rhizobium phage P11VFA]